MLDDCCYAVVMAGGAGTRLWPLSTQDRPKHLLKLFDGKCLIELTVEKLKGHIPDERIVILTSVHYRELTQQHSRRSRLRISSMSPAFVTRPAR